MSRIRTIKPEFWSSEQIVECSPSARLLFIGLWNFCDASGRHSFSPKQIKAQVFPSDDLDIPATRRLLDELSTNDLIVVYEVENKQFLQVTGWHHQKIDRENPSKLPGPFDEGSTIIRGSFAEQPPMEGKGREGKDSSLRSESNIDLSSKDLRPKKNSADKRAQSNRLIEKEFPRFWDLYGHKVKRPESLKAFVKARSKASLEAILDGVKRYHGQRPEWQQIAHPITWLNGERWTDDPVADVQPNGHDPPPRIFVKEGTPQWEAWVKSSGSAFKFQREKTLEFGRFFPTEWPPKEP